MAAIPPKFLYENAGAYFRGELDKETAKAWENTLKAAKRGMGTGNNDWIYWAPLAAGIFCGII